MCSIFKTIFCVLLCFTLAGGVTLQEIYNSADAGDGYDKQLVLKPDSTYTGGFVVDVQSVCIRGNGAIIDLEGETILVDGEGKTLDLNHCIIKSTSDSPRVFIEYSNNASGVIVNNTFWGLNNTRKAPYCLFFEECNKDTTYIINNVFSNFQKSFYFYTMNYEVYPVEIYHIEYNLHWQCDIAYLYYGGWTGYPGIFTPVPGSGELVQDPGLMNPEENDFNLSDTSICIDNGLGIGFPFNGNHPDLGAIESTYSIFRGTRLSGELTTDLLKSDSPYIIMENCVIHPEQKIWVEPGVCLKFGYKDSLIVYGELQLSGTVDDSIVIDNNSVYQVVSGSMYFTESANSLSTISYCNFNDDCTISCFNDSVTIENNRFNGNSIICSNRSQVRINENSFDRSSIRIKEASNPTVTNNRFTHSMMDLDYSYAHIINNRFLGQDYHLPQTYWQLTLRNQSYAYVESNYFTNNYGAILVKDTSSVVSVGNLIVNCSNGINLNLNCSGIVVNNTIYSDNYHGISCNRNSNATVINSIVWLDGNWGTAVMIKDSCYVVVKNCALSTEFDGENIIYDNPLFNDPDNKDFRLSGASPCINTGMTDTLADLIPELDFDGYPRIVGPEIDMGCYEYQIEDAIEQYENRLPSEFQLAQNYPNPFNPSTTIRYSLPETGHVTLNIYDITGRLVDQLINQNTPAGYHTVTWDASRYSSGIYIALMQAGDFVKAQKMVLMK